MRQCFLITGAASGIGKLMALRALSEKNNVVLWDINQQALDVFANENSSKQDFFLCQQVDVCDNTQMQQAIEIAKQRFSQIDVLVNNAGIVVGKYFKEHSEADISKTLQINTAAPMQLTRLLLPEMLTRNSGYIINISSASGYISNPKMSVYAASKAAILNWSHTLYLELEKTNIGVTTVTPSYINTGMFDGVSAPLLTPILEPDDIVEKIWQAMLSKKAFLREPVIVNFIPFLKGIMPTKVFDRVIGKGFGVYTSMEKFMGKKKS